jgi:tripartite-type tricarboxylate transporter receptor subunit TctC
MKKNRFIGVSSRLLAASIVGLSGLAAAQASYPDKTIHMIIPLAAGSAVDAAARIVAQKMSISMNQAIVIENLPGASGIAGADRVAKAAPDGYTIGGFNDSILTMLPPMQSQLPWDPIRDFAPVSLVATVEWGLIANPAAPYANTAAFIKAAQAAPGKIDYGSGGVGSPQHIAMALFASETGIKVNHVPYKGATQAAVGVAAGEVQVAFEGLATVTSLVKSSHVKLLAVTTPKRMAQYPDAPTVTESAVPGFEFNSWFAIVAPAATPGPIVARLNAEVLKALADPVVREQLVAQGLTPRGSSAEELGSATKAQLAKYAALIKKLGIKPE